jgi:hypothetical protein
MANGGVVTISYKSGSRTRHAFELDRDKSSSVTHSCPPGGTYCRSSSQMGQVAGGASLGAYCIPQAVQMNAGMEAGTL